MRDHTRNAPVTPEVTPKLAPLKGVILDLDDTLLPEKSAWSAAFQTACQQLQGKYGDLGWQNLELAVFANAQEVWENSPEVCSCKRLGLGSPSSLLTDFSGDRAEMAALRAWAPEYRKQCWLAGLAAIGVFDSERLAAELSDTFIQAFSRSHKPFPDVGPLLSRFAHLELCILTNGFGDLQRTKLQVSGLAKAFGNVVISSEVGIGKPNPAIFDLALSKLATAPEETLMVGDSLSRDVIPAAAFGLQAAWLNRSSDGPEKPWTGMEIRSLAELTT